MADKTKLRDMLDSVVDDNSEQAQVDFHAYLEDKMKEIVNPVVDVEKDESDDNAE